MAKLTELQKSILQAAIDCDSVCSGKDGSSKFRLQDLNRLAKMGLLEPFDSEPSYLAKSDRVTVWFAITDEGHKALTPPSAAAPTGQQADATPADEAALGISISELDAALNAAAIQSADSSVPVEPTAGVLAGVEKVIDFGDWYELYYRNDVVTVDGFENEPKFSAIMAALEDQHWAKYHNLNTDTYFPRPQAVASEPSAESGSAGVPSLRQQHRDYQMEARQYSIDPLDYAEWLEKTVTIQAESNSLKTAEITRLQSELAAVRAERDALERQVAAYRHDELEQIGDMVYGGKTLPLSALMADDEQTVYSEYQAQLDDHLYSADDVRRYLDLEG